MYKLSPRQLQVARLIDEGLSNDEIAERLGVSVSTVKTHISDLRKTLGVNRKRHIPQQLKELGILRSSVTSYGGEGKE